MRWGWMGAGQWVVALAALVAWGCQSSPPPREAAHGPKPLSAKLNEIQVFDLATGRGRSAWRVVQEDEGVLFTCLCAPCESVARAVADYTEALKQDPPLGLRIAEDWASGSRPKFVIVAQECACNPEILDPLHTAVQGRAELLVVLAASESKADRLRSRLDEGVRILADPEFRVGKALNACFLPRAYLIDGKARLVWKQADYKTTLLDAWKNASAHLSKEVHQ